MFGHRVSSNLLHSDRSQEQVKSISKNNNWLKSYVVIENLKPHFVQNTKKLTLFWNMCPISKNNCMQTKHGTLILGL